MPTLDRNISLELSSIAERRIDLMLDRRVKELPDKEFLAFPDEDLTLTYAELAGSSRNYSGFLRSIGLERGDHLALMLPNSSDWVKVWFGAIGAGIVDVGIHNELGGALLQHQLRCANVKAAVCNQESLGRVLEAVEGANGLVLRSLIVSGLPEAVLSEKAARLGITIHRLSDASASAPVAPIERNPRDLMSIRFTSGTTGPAKAATLSMSQVYVWADYHRQLMQFGEQDRIYAPFPLHHHLASVMGVIGALLAGGSCIVDRHFSASRFWQTAIDYRATLGLILDPVVQILLSRPASPLDRKHTIRRLYIGRPNPDFERRFGARLQTAYALTEGSVLSYVPSDERISLPNCVGYANPHFDIQVVNDMDEPVAAGEQGEILFRPRYPETCMTSYFDDPASTVKALRNYWFHTGDLGKLDEEGRLFFFERMGDTIRRRGVNIPSYHIEELALTYPGVKEAAAVGVPSEVGEFEVKLCIAEKADGAVAIPELTRWLATQLPREMVPRFIEIKKDFERTITQKIIKKALKAEGITANTVSTEQWL
jgi:crotonobetaine/carnitine-CoA ligase